MKFSGKYIKLAETALSEETQARKNKCQLFFLCGSKFEYPILCVHLRVSVQVRNLERGLLDTLREVS